MKTIEQLTNVDKAKLLFELFPSEIPALNRFIGGMCTSIREHEEMNRAKWDNGLMNFDYWLYLLNGVETKLQRYGSKLNHSPHVFADQLFEGMLAVFTNHCIVVYTTVQQHPNPKFSTAVTLLFNP